MRGDRAERGIAHIVQQIIVHDVAGTDDPDPGLVETALGKLLHELPPWPPGTNT
jgi:hypothetical protein